MTDVTGEAFDGFDAEETLAELYELRDEIKESEDRKKLLTHEIASRFSVQDKLLFLDRDGNKRTAQVVRSSTPVIDVIGLKEELPEDVFEKISEHVVKAEVLKEALDTGLVPESIARRHVQYKERKPYVKF